MWILQHHAEKKHAIGTAKIAELSLNNILCINDTDAHKNKTFQSGIKDHTPILIYPSDNSMTVDELKAENHNLNSEPPRPLLFLDGSWRKTYKMFYDFPELNNLRCLGISPDSQSRYRIRKEPNESAVSTLEAIAYVLSKLEDDEEKFKPMLDTMDWMIDKQIEHMGKDVYLKNYSQQKKKEPD